MSGKQSPRMRKVNELLREVIAEEVSRLKDPGMGFVTITGVDTAPDLRSAQVYYSVYGSDEEASSTADAFARAAPHLQGVVAAQVRLKYTPVLEFHVDEAIDQGIRIHEILRSLEHDAEGDGDGN